MISGGKGKCEKAAEVLSVFFHPLFIPLYGLLIIYSSPTLLSYVPGQLKRLIFVVVAIDNVIIPLVITLVLYARRAITTLNARDRNERLMLLSFTLLMYLLTAYLLIRMHVPTLFRAYFISVSVVALVILIITYFYRVSLHAAGIGGLLVLILFMTGVYHISMLWQLITVIITGGAVMSSRIYLDDHLPGEVWTGLLAGAAVMAFSLFIIFR